MKQKRRITLIGVVLAAVASVVMRGRLRRYEIVERSMEPALRPGYFVIARRIRRLSRGAVVVFDHPAPGRIELVKRVIGLPGENIEIRNGRVHVDGRVLLERWADGPTLPDGKWQLGDNEVFVLGDNRSASSADSRMLGPLATATIGWRVIACYWPPADWGRVD